MNIRRCSTLSVMCLLPVSFFSYFWNIFLRLFLIIFFSLNLSLSVSICLSFSGYLFVRFLFVCFCLSLPVYRICLDSCIRLYLSVCLSVCLSFSVCRVRLCFSSSISDFVCLLSSVISLSDPLRLHPSVPIYFIVIIILFIH